MKKQELQDYIASWSNVEFGTSASQKRKIALLKHLQEEVNELIEIQENPIHPYIDIKFGIADCLILIMDYAAKCGLNMNDLFDGVERKMSINEDRRWEGPDKNGLHHHK